MNTYLTIKWVHVLSSVLLVGTGFGSAFYMFFANRSGSVAAQAVVTRLVVRADWWFTVPTIIIQATTGFLLANISRIPLSTPWLAMAIGLFVFAGACWVPVVWLQIRMQAISQAADQLGSDVSPQYWKLARIWEKLGYPAFAAMVVVFWLMVVKPPF